MAATHRLTLAAAACLAATVAGAAVTPCAGRFAVVRATVGPAAPGNVVVLDAASALVDPACGAAPTRVRAMRRGWRVAARWPACGGRSLRLRSRLSRDCTLLRGALGATRMRSSRFVAVRSRCGDGVVDAGIGERCDDGNLLAGDGCDPRCGRCVDPSSLSSTWAAIQANVFDATCIGCHGGTATAGLDLRAPGSYARLVDMPAAGGLFQVRAGDRTASLVWLKIAKATFGSSDENLGGGMPLGFPLPAAIVEAVGRWIDAGAPPGGFVDGADALLAPCGAD